MIRQTPCKPGNINVSVIGFPGINSGTREHVGKSCLINRFMSHLSYCENHISVVSLSDFDGEVICGSHWLYWGEEAVTIGDNISSIKIVEQCDFVDDHLFYPISVNVPYNKRCVNTELVLHSRKLAYVCKDQLGHEYAFPRSYLEPGILHISVFVFVYDMTLSGSSAFQQASFLQQVLLHLSSSKIPAVLATSKHDGEVTEVATNLLENVLKSIKKRWIRRHFCIVETSARLNINVNKVFQCAFSLATARNNDRSKTHASQLFRLLRTSDTSRTLSQRLKNSIDCKLQHFYYEPPVRIPASSQNTQSGLTGFGGFSSYSYCQSECSPMVQNNIWQYEMPSRKDLKCPPTPLLPSFYTPNHYSSVSQPNSIQTVHSSVRTPKPCFRSRCPSNLTVKPRDPSDGSILPTPPPLLLPGPRSPGLFGPVSCPSFFESPRSIPDTSPDLTLLPRSIAMSYPLARLYVHGSIETVDVITKSLAQSCPLDRYHTRLGHQYRVWIFPGSKPEESKTAPTSPTMSTQCGLINRRPDFLSIRPAVHTNLNKSQLSAFSAPSQSPAESSPDFPPSSKHLHTSNSTKSQTFPILNTIPSCPISPVNKIPNNSLSKPLSSSLLSPNSSVQLCLHISTYSTAVELQTSMLFLDSIDSNFNMDSTNQPSSCKVVKFLVFWCLSHNPTNMIDLMLRGIHLTSSAKIPLIIVDQKSSSCLLSHLLDLASTYPINQLSNTSSSTYCDHYRNSVDFTCLLPSIVQQLPFELILSPSLNIVPIEFHFDGILAGLIFHDRHSNPTQIDSSSSSQSHSTTNRLFFLSPTVAVPTAIRIKPSNMSFVAHQCSSCFGPRFLRLEQAIKLLQDHLSFGECSTTSTFYYNTLVIHCHASQWIDQQKTISKTIETLLAIYSSSSNKSHSTKCQSSCLIILVIVNKELNNTTHYETYYLQYLSNLIRTYHQTILLVAPNSKCQTISNGSTRENTSTNSQKPNTPLPVIHSDLISNTNHQTLSKTTTKVLLAVLSVSPTDPVSKSLYRRIFEGDLDGWYSIDKFNLPSTIIPTTTVDTNTIDPSKTSYSNPLANTRSIPCPTTSVYETIPSLNSTNQMHSIGAGMVELPWLPMNPADALRMPFLTKDQSSSSGHATVTNLNSLQNSISTIVHSSHGKLDASKSDRNSNDPTKEPNLDRIPTVPSSSDFWMDSYRNLSQSSNDPQNSNYPIPSDMNNSTTANQLSVSLATESCSVNSSVEEYYAELPKITQPNVFKLDYQRSHPNRPKRPLPRTASVNSHSSQSSSPLFNDLNRSRPNSVDHPIPSVHYGDCDFDKTHDFRLTCSLTHSSHPSDGEPIVEQSDNDDVSALYAEVNDALVYKEPSESCPPQLPPPRTNSKLTLPSSMLCCHYDLPYTSPTLTTSIRDLIPCTSHTPRATSTARPNSQLVVQNNGSTKSCKARFFKSDSPQLVNFKSHPKSNGYHTSHSNSAISDHSNLGGPSYPPPVQPAPPPPPLTSMPNFPNPCQSAKPSTTLTMCRHHSTSPIGSNNAYHVSDIPAETSCMVRCNPMTATAATGVGGGNHENAGCGSTGGCISSWHCQHSEKDCTFATFQTFSPPYCDNKQTTSSDSNTNSSASVPSQPNHSISSTLDSLTAAFKRHGEWLRHSTSRRSRKSKA